MKHALIYENQVIQIEEKPFDVARPLYWAKCGDDIGLGHGYQKGKFYQSLPTKAKMLEEIAQVIKSHAYALITEQYPLWKQLQIISDKEHSPESFATMKAFIDGVRERSNAIERKVSRLTKTNLSALDVTDDHLWS